MVGGSGFEGRAEAPSPIRDSRRRMEMEPSAVTKGTPPLVYLVSQYPAVNHTHILREIRGLRENGLGIDVISIRPADRPPSQLTAVEREEQSRTRVVLDAGAARLAIVQVSAFLRRPLRYVQGIGAALRLGGVRRSPRYLIYFAEAVQVGEWMRRRGITHLHAQFTSTVAYLVARTFPVTFSATIHGSAEFLEPHFHMAEKLDAALFVRTISDYGRGEVLRLSGRGGDHAAEQRVEVARLGVDPAEFAPSPRAVGRFEMLTVGQLAPAKAPLLLLAAIRRLVANATAAGHADFRLRWVGGGPLRSEVEAYVAAHGLQAYVQLEGNCSQDRVRELYRETDLFVLPSKAEGIPVVLMEAMATEIPCVATRITGIPELIRHGEEGWLVPSGDEAQLAEAIAYLRDRPELRERLGQAGRRRVIRDYNLATNVGHLATIFRCRLP